MNYQYRLEEHCMLELKAGILFLQYNVLCDECLHLPENPCAWDWCGLKVTTLTYSKTGGSGECAVSLPQCCRNEASEHHSSVNYKPSQSSWYPLWRKSTCVQIHTNNVRFHWSMHTLGDPINGENALPQWGMVGMGQDMSCCFSVILTEKAFFWRNKQRKLFKSNPLCTDMNKQFDY